MSLACALDDVLLLAVLQEFGWISCQMMIKVGARKALCVR